MLFFFVEVAILFVGIVLLLETGLIRGLTILEEFWISFVGAVVLAVILHVAIAIAAVVSAVVVVVFFLTSLYYGWHRWRSRVR
jgi:O-antigen/teichoic acid export membrane protein